MNEIDAVLFREFERAAHDRIASSYEAFLVPITANAAIPLLDAVHANVGTRLLDIATGPGVVAARAARCGATSQASISHPKWSLLRHASVRIANSSRQMSRRSHSSLHRSTLSCAPLGSAIFPTRPSPCVSVVGCSVLVGRLAVAWWDLPDRNRLHGVMLEAIQEVGARPPSSLPAGPALFQYSDDAALSGLLGAAGLCYVMVVTHPFLHRIASTRALWDGSTRQPCTYIRADPRPACERSSEHSPGLRAPCPRVHRQQGSDPSDIVQSSRGPEGRQACESSTQRSNSDG